MTHMILGKHLKSILAYGFLVSVPATIAEWGSFALCLYTFGWHYLPASVIAFFAGTSVNSILSRQIGFLSKGRSASHETLLIFITSIGSYALNVGVLSLCVEWLGLGPMIGKVAGTLSAFVANYMLRQFYIFSATPRWK